MPEGHTVHRAAREQEQLFGGRPLAVSSPQGRFAGAVEVDGRCLVGVEAYGKHSFARFDNDLLVHVHLGLFGKWWVHRGDEPPTPREASRMRWIGDGATIDLTGPTACAVGTDELYRSIVGRLGPDPLRGDAVPQRFAERVLRSRTTIGQLLMDQSVVAGIGNVYRAEALFVHGIWPGHAGRSIDPPVLDELWRTLVTMLRAGVRTGRIVTVAPAERRAADHRDKHTYVYKREHCLRCGTPVRRWDLAGRWCYACPACQR